MSVHRKGGRWVVRWRNEGRQQSRSFARKRDAEAFERYLQRSEWRDSLATPTGAVSAAVVNEGTSFHVVENLYDDGAFGQPLYDDNGRRLPSGQRPVHDGFFTSIRQAERYRRQMPDADALSIVLLHDRYPSRDLTDDEIAAGDVDENLDDPVMRMLEEADK